MSDHIQTNANESKHDIPDQVRSQQQPRPRNNEDQLSNEIIYDKQELLVERVNNTFQELCRTLENEQSKLFELEERRKKLQEEMLHLKAEIEDEKQSFNLNIEQSVAENLTALNNASNNNFGVCDQSQKMDENIKMKNLYTCYEEEEEYQPVTARNMSVTNSQELKKEEIIIEDHVQYIESELQNVLSQCITEQCDD